MLTNILLQVLKEVDCHLFSLLILKGLSDSRGNVWRCHPNQFYMVEVTVPTKNKVSLYKSKMYTECTRKVDFMKNVDQSDTVLEGSKKGSVVYIVMASL